MSELGTHKYLAGQNNQNVQSFQGGGLVDSVADKINDPRLAQAKEHAQENSTVSMLTSLTEGTIKSPLDFAIVYLSGFAATLGFTKLADSLLKGPNLADSKFVRSGS